LAQSFTARMPLLMATIPESYRSQLVRVADLPGWRSRRSARTNCLLVPSMKLSTVGGRAFPVAGPTIWNSLPDNVISAPSLSTFCQRLKTFLSCRPRSLTLSLIPGKLFPTSSGSWSDFITWTTVRICDWLIDWLIEPAWCRHFAKCLLLCCLWLV